MLHISASEVEQLLDLRELLETVREALIDLSAGRVVQPVRTLLTTVGPSGETTGWFGLMPAIYKDVMGAKLVTVLPSNAGLGLHTHNAVVQLFTAQTGEPLAILDGRVITAWRTAAVSALATRELAAPDARVHAILGSGVQARTHHKALQMVRDFEDVRVWSRDSAHAAAFAQEIGARVATLEEAVRGADVVTAVTNYREPFVEAAWLKPGAHVNAVGSVGLSAHEVHYSVLQEAAVVVESRAAALCESAEIVNTSVEIYAELGELLGGMRAKPEARHTVYKGLGVAVEDVATARLIYQKVLRLRQN